MRRNEGLFSKQPNDLRVKHGAAGPVPQFINAVGSRGSTRGAWWTHWSMRSDLRPALVPSLPYAEHESALMSFVDHVVG
jgi:hypothetical protein